MGLRMGSLPSLILGVMLGVGLAACGPSYEEKRLSEAVRKKSVEEVRKFLRYT